MHQNQTDALSRHLVILSGKEPSRILARMWNQMNHTCQRSPLPGHMLRLPERPEDTAAEERRLLEALLSQVVLGEKNSRARLLDQISESEAHFNRAWQPQRDALAVAGSCPSDVLPPDEQRLNHAFIEAAHAAREAFLMLRQVATAAKRVKAPRKTPSAGAGRKGALHAVLHQLLSQLKRPHV